VIYVLLIYLAGKTSHQILGGLIKLMVSFSPCKFNFTKHLLIRNVAVWSNFIKKHDVRKFGSQKWMQLTLLYRTISPIIPTGFYSDSCTVSFPIASKRFQPLLMILFIVFVSPLQVTVCATKTSVAMPMFITNRSFKFFSAPQTFRHFISSLKDSFELLYKIFRLRQTSSRHYNSPDELVKVVAKLTTLFL